VILKILSVDTLIKTLNFSCDLDPKLSHLTFSLDTPWLLKSVNMVLNVHRNHKAYYNIRDREKGGMEVREEGEYIPIATLSPPE